MLSFSELFIKYIADVLSDVIMTLLRFSSARVSIAVAIVKISGSSDDEFSLVFSMMFNWDVSLKITAKAADLLFHSAQTLQSVVIRILSVEPSSLVILLVILAALSVSLSSLIEVPHQKKGEVI